MKMTTRAIGIDLGTTYSAVAVLEGGKPKIIENAEGRRVTPSVVHIGKDGERLVGQHAKAKSVIAADRTIRSIKREMGRDFTAKAGDKDYSPQEVSAMVLQKLKKDAETYLGHPVKDAVVTVPAYFTDSQRQATKDAGKIAGLNVLRIINEPTAAALAYGMEKEDGHKILVYDLGGGTFDVSILEVGDGVFEVKSTNGNNYLGGDDFDSKIQEWLVKEFKNEKGIDLSGDKNSMQRLREAAENAKIELSNSVSTTINLPFITANQDGPIHYEKTLSRAKFEELVKDQLDSTMGPVQKALEDAKMQPSELDEIILVGGSTRIPYVQSLLKEKFGKDPFMGINPDECVALGAAIQAGVIQGEIKDVVLLDVTPLTLGIETLGGVTTRMIERNTTIPTKKTETFSTAADNQPAVEIHVLQGERQFARDNVTLGKFQLIGIPPAPRGMPQIEVTFDIDVNGIVKVSALDKATNKSQDITITSSTNLSTEEVERMVEEAAKNEEEDKKQRDLIEAQNQMDALIYQLEKALKDLPEDKITPEEKEQVEKAMEEARKKKEGATTAKDIQDAMEELQKSFHGISQKLYEEMAKQGQEGEGGPEFSSSEPSVDPGSKHQDKPNDEDVIDGEFKDV